MLAAVIILSILLAISIFVIFNLLRKNEVQEDILFSYQKYLNKISGIIDFSKKKVEEIDAKGTFKSDDEVGFFFDQIKQIQEELNNFRIE